jgi:acetoin utilization deacetylase AcuC-like enzyme
MIVYSEKYKEHDQEYHPENNQRLLRIMRHLTRMDVFEEVPLFEPRYAGREDLLRAHSLEHVENIRRLCESGDTNIGMDTYITFNSYETARLSAGGVLTCVDKFFEGYRHSFALTRPPGHHAERNKAMGFCLFNNAAIAARYAAAEYGVDRVVILDFDVHHGNGTQDIFYSDPGVFYISLHQFPHYPGTGSIDETGSGRGAGLTLNIPLPPKTRDRSFLKAIDEVVIPAIRRYKPGLVIVSAGYDAHHSDPLGGLELSHSCYYEVSRRLMDNTPGLIYALEGGYNLNSLPESVYASMMPLFDLRGEPPEPPMDENPAVTRYVERRLSILREKFEL